VILENRFLNDPPHFFNFGDYLPFEEDLALYLNKLELFLSPKDNMYLSMIEFVLLVLEKILKKNSVYFYSFAIISPRRRVIPFI
jgi:hypothetical protein